MTPDTEFLPSPVVSEVFSSSLFKQAPSNAAADRPLVFVLLKILPFALCLDEFIEFPPIEESPSNEVPSFDRSIDRFVPRAPSGPAALGTPCAAGGSETQLLA
ncbi:unnamed protein product [Cylindrotheca closterium]|uniref:Uncharacterized protein n=1 Tax=Cylindrotheca closterium TaxID=2856 RepID=A0AAD2CBD4_9STRA|nr:unnamed protein product [Cylindrotheca closterium]